MTGCDAGGASPYTPALEAAGLTLAWQHEHGAHHDASPPPDRVAVTKALTAVDPDHPELRAAVAAGIPLESWQQVVADAAVGRTLVGRRRDARQEHDRGLAGARARRSAGLDPSAFVGALLPERDHGRAAVDGALGAGRAVRRRGRRVRRQLRRLPAGHRGR